MNHPGKPAAVHFPRCFSISAPAGKTDYSIAARDVAVEVKFTYRINGTVQGYNGQSLLTGWHEAACVKTTFFVSIPVNDEAALEAVREAGRELASTLRLFRDSHDLLAILTDIPLGFRVVGAPRIVARKRPRTPGYVADFITSIQDAWKKQIHYWETRFAAENAAERATQNAAA